MKKINHYVLNGAIALLSTAGFVACSSSDDVTDAPVNPSYDGKSVKTQFAINIATPVSGKTSTRMTGGNTQNGSGTNSNTGTFLGMNNINLLTFKEADVFNVTTSSAQRTSNIQLDQVITLAQLNASDISDTQSSKIYTDVYIPVGTSQFLFYGTGPIGSSNNKDRFSKGTLATPTIESGQTLANIEYSLVTTLSENSGYTTTAQEFSDYLDAIVNSSYTNSTSMTSTWASLGDESKWQTLKTAYTNFTSVGSNGARGGSANAILFTLKQLYEICENLSSSSDNDVKGLAGAIKDNITNASGTIKVKATAEQDTKGNTTGYKLEYDGLVDKYSTFPATYGLPEGAAQLTFDTTNKFEYVTNGNVGNAGSTGTNANVAFDVNNVTYPAALTYFVHTPARATTKEIATTGTGTDVWPTTVASWDGVWNASTGYFKDWTKTVNSNSRSVALQYNINYGVACLATTVKCADKAYLEDNSAAMNSESSNQQITIPTGGFHVTGILIGGQSKTVGWDFLNPKSNDQKYVVYDNDLSVDASSNGVWAKRNSESSKNYTLVFDNYVSDATDGKQPAVNIALELVNDKEEFFGVDGRIAPGQKFYLVAKLDPNDNNTGGTASGSINWPETTKSNFPATNVNRVFIQDYTTTANFTINSLKNAYVTIPDLRASKLQLGLSVDLTWQSGLTFDVPIN